MLISVTLENWMSFRDPTTFSMVAGDEKEHADRLFHVKNYDINLLPIAAIFGGNASGKSNFIKAVECLVDSVRDGEFTPPDTIMNFALDSTFANKETKFTLVILVGDIIYKYFLAVKGGGNISEEELTQLNHDGSDGKIIFKLKGKESLAPLENIELGKIKVEEAQGQKRPSFLSKNEGLSALRQLIAFKKSNQLFLSELKERGVESIRPIFDAIAHIIVFTPNTKARLKDDAPSAIERLVYFMRGMDTGITDIKVKEVPQSEWGIPIELVQHLIKELNNDRIPEGFGMPLPRLSSRSDEVFLFKTKQGIVGRKYQNFHGNAIPFSQQMESDGTQRLLELAPMFLSALDAKKTQTVLIDEFDRSLHSLLTLHMLELYLDSCSEITQKQFILTSHDIEVLADMMLRLDEKWVVRRDDEGTSKITLLAQYENMPRTADAIRREYKDGRLGGTPNLLKTDFTKF